MSYSLIANVLVVGAIVVMVGLAHASLKVIHSLPNHYYNLLPVANQTDLDRDGIPDYIDDSDGDGIADAQDPLPYGK